VPHLVHCVKYQSMCVTLIHPCLVIWVYIPDAQKSDEFKEDENERPYGFEWKSCKFWRVYEIVYSVQFIQYSEKYFPFWMQKLGILFIIPSLFFIGIDVEWDPRFLTLRTERTIFIGWWLIGCYLAIREATFFHFFVAVAQGLKRFSLVCLHQLFKFVPDMVI
jgi:hypothetical protein